MTMKNFIDNALTNMGYKDKEVDSDLEVVKEFKIKKAKLLEKFGFEGTAYTLSLNKKDESIVVKQR